MSDLHLNNDLATTNMSQPNSVPVDQSKTANLKLGQVAINNTAFDLDLKINEGYQNYSAELLRLALLIITGLAAVWLKLYLKPDANQSLPWFNRISFALSFMANTIAAGTALIHRYIAADSLAYQLTALRRRARNDASRGNCPSDVELADMDERERDRLFKLSSVLLRLSVCSLFLGLLLFFFSLIHSIF